MRWRRLISRASECSAAVGQCCDALIDLKDLSSYEYCSPLARLATLSFYGPDTLALERASPLPDSQRPFAQKFLRRVSLGATALLRDAAALVVELRRRPLLSCYRATRG